MAAEDKKTEPSKRQAETKEKRSEDIKSSEPSRGGETQHVPTEEEIPPAAYPRVQQGQPDPLHIVGGGTRSNYPRNTTDVPPLSERPPGFEDEYEIGRSLRDNQPSSGYPRIPAVGQDDLNPPGLGGGPPYPLSNVPPNPLSDDRHPGSSSGMIPGPNHPIFGGGPYSPSLPGMGPGHPRGARFDPTGAPLDEFTDPEGSQNQQQHPSRLGPFGGSGPSNPFGGSGGGFGGFGGSSGYGGGGGGFI